jgi:hypothetical protein
MERPYRWTVLLFVMAAGAGFANAARIDVAPSYLNARVVAIDAVQRTMVIANGACELDPESHWDLSALAAVIDPRDPRHQAGSHTDWDTDGDREERPTVYQPDGTSRNKRRHS